MIDFVLMYDQYIVKKCKDYYNEAKQAVDEISDAVTMTPSSEKELLLDNANFHYFANVREITMAYLHIKQDINAMPPAAQGVLLQRAEEMRETAKELFDCMNLYMDEFVNKPDISAFMEFFDIFYNQKECDIGLFDNLSDELETATKEISLKEKESIINTNLQQAYLKFGHVSALAETIKLACDVEKNNIANLKDYSNKLNQKISNTIRDYAVVSKMTVRGYVTHAAFAFNNYKKDNSTTPIRDKRASAIERVMLSSYKIPNKVVQQKNHVGFGRLKVITVPTQYRYGKDRDKEALRNMLISVAIFKRAGAKITDSIQGLVTACYKLTYMKQFSKTAIDLIRNNTEQLGQIKSILKEGIKNIDTRKIQEKIGKNVNLEDVEKPILEFLILEIKKEKIGLSNFEKYQLGMKEDLIEFGKDLLSNVVNMIENNEPVYKADVPNPTFDSLMQVADEMITQGFYEKLTELDPCDGTKDASVRKLMMEMIHCCFSAQPQDQEKFYNNNQKVADVLAPYVNDIDLCVQHDCFFNVNQIDNYSLHNATDKMFFSEGLNYEGAHTLDDILEYENEDYEFDR